MQIGNFELRVVRGRELSGGYVEMEHDSRYRIVMNNRGSVRCDASVNVDGKFVGAFRIGTHSMFVLERPSDDKGCFTFYRAGSKKAEQAGLGKVSASDMGLISVTFRPEREREVPKGVVREEPTAGGFRGMSSFAPESFSGATRGGSSGQSAGGTGLSGYSSQEFQTVSPLNYDVSSEVTITLRLVTPAKQKDARELKPSPQSNPIPDPV